MFNDLTSPLSLLATRRSGKPREMVAPGPNSGELAQMLEIAARTPDHGKLAPWRFVIVDRESRPALADMLVAAYRAEKPEAGRLEIEAMENFAGFAPTLVVVLSSPRASSKIPLWEQELSAGAVCMNLLHAAHAMGFAAGWITGWPAFNADVRNAFGSADERVAGFIYIGTPGKPLEERPRPEMEEIVSHWRG
ncbi:nitroreductase [Sphingomonas sp. C3-2]|uniref:nitroreductase family protein n=1 Tax=Sphingomonas sp. C3-2 TaxID=3062169 RepID=UPI00294B6B82|nr:nitroreductase [Sphingomonas sp. C3-2]WOK36261.1 nitroreductase [Sphingomonas sp. C3-2]